ncbi:hypothetical protein [Natrononativus amylolyticus]|uniref:hypothetical protein n=1 Tax=Natrononativus amylolyticus TaxID=2963434 RepID=UPI0020CFD167|nr:hypothetical protein [Natrononativus amylolyticus]
MGTNTRNPTVTFYGNFGSSYSQRFARNHLQRIIQEFVKPGKLNLEFRHLSENPDSPSSGYLWSNVADERYMAEVVQTTWHYEPENFWSFFQYMMENPPSGGSFTNSDARAALEAAGVRNYVRIPNEANRGWFTHHVEHTTETAKIDDIPSIPRLVIRGEHLSGNDGDVLDWLESHVSSWNEPIHMGSSADGSSSGSDDSGPQLSRSEWTIMDGTRYETPVYEIDSGEPGPTGFVVGGQHGIEPAGWEAAHNLRDMTPKSGKLVVIPEADRTAIRANTYSGDGGNLNRQWPSGSRPSSPLARAIWNEIEAQDPDVILDLHSSQGIYGGSPSGVGQAIFPTPNARSGANEVIDELNERHVRPAGYSGDHLFSRGNDQTGANPLLSHKIGGDTDALGFLFETTRSGVPLETRIDWTTVASVKMLRRGGLVLE